MTKEEFAAMLDGREYPFCLTHDEKKLAKAFRLLVINGASDDLLEFDGAFTDELSAYKGVTAWISGDGELLPTVTDEDAEVLMRHHVYKYVCEDLRAETTEVRAIWDEKPYAWIIKTEAPHAEFDILEDGEKYCRAIVLALDEIKRDNHAEAIRKFGNGVDY